MKRVYLTDLDGTLLRPDATLSGFAREALCRLFRAGVCVGISTARTAATVSRIFAGVPLLAPAALMNGACIFDVADGRYIRASTIGRDALAELLSAVDGRCAFVYTVEDGRLSTYYENDDEPHARLFRTGREAKYGKVFTRVPSLSCLAGRDVVYMSLAEKEEQLQPIRRRLESVGGLSLHYYRDIYDTDFFYLETCAAGVSKHDAADFIRSYTGADELIGFGDNTNDLSLFEGCDVRIAVENAAEDVKRAADTVIGANTCDAVVRYILGREKIPVPDSTDSALVQSGI